jgi:hypothetical protein
VKKTTAGSKKSYAWRETANSWNFLVKTPRTAQHKGGLSRTCLGKLDKKAMDRDGKTMV